MKNTIFLMFTAFMMLLLLNVRPAHAKVLNAIESEPSIFAFLRQREQSKSIEIFINSVIDKTRPVSVSIYKKEEKVSKRIAKNDNVSECSDAPRSGEICYNTSSGKVSEIIYYFSAQESSEQYQVLLSFVGGNAEKEKKEINQIINVGKDFTEVKTAVETIFDKNNFRIDEDSPKKKFTPNGVITVTIKFQHPKELPDSLFNDYVENRIDAIYDWAEPNSLYPSKFAAIELETAAGSSIQELNESPYGIKINPSGRSQAYTSKLIVITLLPGRKLPNSKFLAGVRFKNDPPMELSGHFPSSSVELKTLPAPEANSVGKDETLGLRDFKNNLDLGLALTSSIEDKEQPDGSNVRKRKNQAYLDLRLAPISNHPLDRNRKYWFTPFFIDAKISNGKISKDSLSLNRIILGTEFSIRQLTENQNKYIYTFRGINASDRDFKVSEIKFNFEFRPLFDFLNNPLKVQYKYSKSKIKPGEEIRINDTKFFGYQIQPYAGFETGRVYRMVRPPFINEENSRNVRRLFFGTDLLFNLSRAVNIKLSDVFYIRGESSDAKRRNYFNGELQVPIIDSSNSSQHLFISFEKGDQPPFSTRSVNSFKIGYRIASNFFGQTTVR